MITNRERNYKANPHTATWLRIFHDANGMNYRSETEPESSAAAVDLLDEVPVEAPPFMPSVAQRAFINDLTDEITKLDARTGTLAVNYTAKMDRNLRWTPGREGTVSVWIDHLKSKRTELRIQARQQAQADQDNQCEIPALPQVPDGRYAVELDGEVKCYHLETGKPDSRWAGFRFLNRRSSDDLFAIRNADEKARILAAIVSAGIEAAEILYGLTVKECRRCHRALTDTKNPYYSVALGPDCGGK